MLSRVYMSFSYIPDPAQPWVEGLRAFAIDPVCGAATAIYSPVASVLYQGAAYYFCSESCHACFTREPGKYHRAAKPPST